MTPSTVIECRNIEKTYVDGARTLRVLRGLNLEVYEGEILAIRGPSGAGKSTLLHIMGTLDKPTAGEVFYRGINLAALNGGAYNRIRNKEIGFVFQFYHLLAEFTALENVMMPGLAAGKSRKTCKDRAAALLERVGLAERLTHKPGQLSGGEQQRVAIARALFNEPGIVLADEPTGNLDEDTGKGVTELLWSLNEREGITLALVTHDENVAAQAHRTAHLHEGVIQHIRTGHARNT